MVRLRSRNDAKQIGPLGFAAEVGTKRGYNFSTNYYVPSVQVLPTLIPAVVWLKARVREAAVIA